MRARAAAPGGRKCNPSSPGHLPRCVRRQPVSLPPSPSNPTPPGRPRPGCGPGRACLSPTKLFRPEATRRVISDGAPRRRGPISAIYDRHARPRDLASVAPGGPGGAGRGWGDTPARRQKGRAKLNSAGRIQQGTAHDDLQSPEKPGICWADIQR